MLFVMGWLVAATARAAEPVSGAPVGEAFGRPVSESEFAYYYKSALLFTRTGNTGERNEDEIRRQAWQDLLLAAEADRLGIHIDRTALEEQLGKLVAERGLAYGTPEYRTWVPAAMHEDVATFERRIEGLMRINAVIKLKLDPDVAVTDQDVEDQFVDQNNSLELEYVQCGAQEDADALLARLAQDRSLWKPVFDRRRAEAGRSGAGWISRTTLEGLRDVWQIGRDEAMRLLQAQEGAFVAAKSGSGPAVFRILEKRATSLEALTVDTREVYRKTLTMVKKHQVATSYLDDLLQRAHYRDLKMSAKKYQAP